MKPMHAKPRSSISLRQRLVLVARWVGIVSAAWRVICSCGSSTDGGSTDAYRYSTGYGCTTVNATVMVMDTTVMDTTASTATATTATACERVS